MRLLVVAAVLAAALSAHAAAPLRPLPGEWLVVMNGITAGLPIYEKPGVGRVAEFDPVRLPQLTAGATAAAVTLRKGEWLRIVYDDNGREGWLRTERSWSVSRWPEYLAGRQVTAFPGAKLLGLSATSSPDRPPVPVGDGKPLRVVAVQGDWLQATGGTDSYRIRWRDDNGRLLLLPRE